MSFRIVLAVAIAAALITSAVAFAARPAKDSNFAWCTSKTLCPMTFNTNKRGTKIIDMSLFTKCATVPLEDGSWPSMRVNRKGKFSKTGTVTDVLGQKLDYEIQGKFVRKKKAKGTFDVDGPDCSDREREFIAKRQGPAT